MRLLQPQHPPTLHPRHSCRLPRLSAQLAVYALQSVRKTTASSSRRLKAHG